MTKIDRLLIPLYLAGIFKQNQIKQPKTYICKECGKEFIPECPNKSTYCSAKCYKKHFNLE